MSVMVLGMHRSGSSAAVGLLRAGGLRVPREDHLKPLAKDELKGFFEAEVLVDINEEILEALGGHWSAPPRVESGWTERSELEELKIRGRKAFRDVMPERGWIWKDPRNCLTLPFWQSVIGRRHVVLFMYRDPREVARSLVERAGLRPVVGLALWERYVRDALSNVCGLPVIMSDCRDLQRDPLCWTRDITGKLRSIGVEAEDVDEERAISFCRSPLARLSLRIGSPVAESLSSEQEELVSLVESVGGMHESFPPLEMPSMTMWAEALLEERRGFFRASEVRLELQEKLKEERVVWLDKKEDLGGRNERLKQRNLELARRNRELARRNRELARRLGELGGRELVRAAGGRALERVRGVVSQLGGFGSRLGKK